MHFLSGPTRDPKSVVHFKSGARESCALFKRAVRPRNVPCALSPSHFQFLPQELKSTVAQLNTPTPRGCLRYSWRGNNIGSSSLKQSQGFEFGTALRTVRVTIRNRRVADPSARPSVRSLSTVLKGSAMSPPSRSPHQLCHSRSRSYHYMTVEHKHTRALTLGGEGFKDQTVSASHFKCLLSLLIFTSSMRQHLGLMEKVLMLKEGNLQQTNNILWTRQSFIYFILPLHTMYLFQDSCNTYRRIGINSSW